MLRLAVAALVMFASVAHASPEETPPVIVSAPSEDGPSRSVAVMLSVGTTLGGLLMLASAERDPTAMFGVAVMTVGPSTGRWYAGEASLSGIGLRGLATLSVLYGLENDGSFANSVLVAGGALWIGSALLDVVLADRAARDYYARHLVVAPARVGTPDAGATGLVLAGRF